MNLADGTAQFAWEIANIPQAHRQVWARFKCEHPADKSHTFFSSIRYLGFPILAENKRCRGLDEKGDILGASG